MNTDGIDLRSDECGKERTFVCRKIERLPDCDHGPPFPIEKPADREALCSMACALLGLHVACA
jgi:hypothetical protein